MTDEDRLAALLRAMGAQDRPQAAAHLRELIRTRAAMGDRWLRLSRLAFAIAEPRLAVAAAEALLASRPGEPAASLLVCAALAEAGRVRDALDLAGRLPAGTGGPGSLDHFMGTALSQLGETEAALDRLRRALQARPQSGPTWLTLAALKRFEAGDPDLDALVRAADTGPREERSALLYARSKAYDDVGDTRRAFIDVAEATALQRASQPYDAAAFDALVEARIRGFDRGFFERLGPGLDAESPAIFVVGLPRSGSTLVEQMLAAHPSVADGAEHNAFFAATAFAAPYTPADVARTDAPGRWRAVAEDYARLMAERFGADGRPAVDKTLAHADVLGLILHVLPRAKAIWMRRDPADNAWSCYRTRFATGVEWSCSLTDLARRFRASDRLFALWRDLYPDRVLEVPYEALVGDPETWARRAAEHAGLAYDPAMMAFHQSRRPVLTASVAQVRRPVSTASVGGWRRYETQLAPFLEAYQRP